MNDKEKRIKEQRLIEATRKGFTGLSGKFGIILKHLGQPIIAQNDAMHFNGYIGRVASSNQLPWHDPEEIDHNELPTMEMLDVLGNPIEEPMGAEWTSKTKSRTGGRTNHVGMYFDGLKYSMHLAIKYTDLKDEYGHNSWTELEVTYKGYSVYKEIKGELAAYVPNTEWEEKIEKLFKIAKEKEDQFRDEERQERIKEAKQKKNEWIQKLRTLWGI